MTETTEDLACSDWVERALKIHAVINQKNSGGECFVMDTSQLAAG